MKIKFFQLKRGEVVPAIIFLIGTLILTIAAGKLVQSDFIIWRESQKASTELATPPWFREIPSGEQPRIKYHAPKDGIDI